ncbi:GNAT family N-acetyltransferase [Streptomyces sp. CC53]|uniref:GNAT family N-acetyltransferase n=1 Tax=unclassified Streptomyces TaxID=2593676 RepID=UPI0008DD81F4|nr:MULTISPECIES: GNAT family N-acetyltransferase [unclassified Streptomyces]OII65266.1 GNAT family N-acetyltransferase [Streptomyces sp. CC53]
MTVIVRDARPEDLPRIVDVRRAVLPFLVETPESLHAQVRNAPAARRHRLLVAERDGQVVGASHAGIAHDSPEPGRAFASPMVHPAHRGHGVGGLLLRVAEEHLAAEGATVLHAWVLDLPEHREFAERRGYRRGRSARFQRLDLAGATLPGPPETLPPGVALCTAADFADDPRPMFEADAEVTADEPSDVPEEFGDYEEWLRHTWHHPLLDHELSSVATVDGRVAAFTAAHVDRRGRYLSGMTGTLRAYRGRGLAGLVKADSLRRARAAGCTEAFTSNDDGNGPMLAVNSRLGYEPCGTEVRYGRALG